MDKSNFFTVEFFCKREEDRQSLLNELKAKYPLSCNKNAKLSAVEISGWHSGSLDDFFKRTADLVKKHKGE